MHTKSVSSTGQYRYTNAATEMMSKATQHRHTLMHRYTPAYVRTHTYCPLSNSRSYDYVSCDYCPTPFVPKAPPIKVLRVGDHLHRVMGGWIVGDTAQVPVLVMSGYHSC